MEEIKNLFESLGIETEKIFDHKSGSYTVYFDTEYMLSNSFFEKLGNKYNYTIWYSTTKKQICITVMKKI